MMEEVPEGVRLLCETLPDQLGDLVLQSKLIEEEQVILRRSAELSPTEYQKLMAPRSDEIIALLVRLQSLWTALLVTAFQPTDRELREIQLRAGECMTGVRMLLEAQRELASLVPPPALAGSRDAFMTILTAAMRQFGLIEKRLRDVAADPNAVNQLLQAPTLVTGEQTSKVEEIWKREWRAVGAANCFIASAACGDEDHEMVRELRTFRDQTLRLHGWGRFLISFYERRSPPIARQIRRSTRAMALTRLALRPVATIVATINRNAHRRKLS